MSDDDQLQDPVVLGALRRLARAGDSRRELCPGCGRRHLERDQELCDDCRTQQRKRGKADWKARQGDYRLLRLDHGPRDAAARWIAEQLRRGPLEVAEIRDAAARAGIATKTLRRAREQLQASGRLVVERHGLPPGRVRWRLTSTAERRTNAHEGIGSEPDRADSARDDGASSGDRP